MLWIALMGTSVSAVAATGRAAAMSAPAAAIATSWCRGVDLMRLSFARCAHAVNGGGGNWTIGLVYVGHDARQPFLPFGANAAAVSAVAGSLTLWVVGAT